MKKLISLIILLIVIALCLPVYADALQNVTVNVEKSTVHPNETVKVDVNFGQEMGSYTVDVAYDNNLFEYVSAEGGKANDNGTRIRVYFFDETGGTSPRNKMSVVFKAKDVTTSNLTNFSITAEGLANSDASITYDDITVPINKSITVEPQITTPPDNNQENNEIGNEIIGGNDNNNITNESNNQVTGSTNNMNNTNNEKPSTLPKTGSTVYLTGASIILALAVSYFTLKKDKQK